MRLLSHLLPAPASSRAHPDPTTDVWELAVWDPLPLALEVYTLFSPGHAVVYWLLLPVGGDARPSLTVVTALVLQALLSVQMGMLVQNFTQKEKDGRVIQKEVLNEYDTKFVHPTMHPIVRDVGTQISTSLSPPTSTSTSSGTDAPDFDPDASTISITSESITTAPPTTLLRRGFKINPNPNYASHISPRAPDAVPNRNSLPTSVQPFGTPQQTPHTPQTPVGQMGYAPAPMSSAQMQLQQGQAYQQGLVGVQQPQFNRRDSTPLRATPSVGQLRGQQPGQYRASMGARIGSEGPVSSGAEEELVRRAVGGHRTTSSSSGLSRVHSGGSASGSGDEGLRGRSRASDVGARREERRGGGDGGSLGIYSHAHSPLKKASSMYDITRREGPRNGAQAAAREVAEERERVRRRG
ncbi:hypothetical protein V497_03400 [Pseudogymnoascus sp. VKM F-4516 (FW-969)]|nr:hypothetical protein V497_03400 [Pseudogymnoascus sp. VKM F-4516 (FW-969)]